MNKLYEMTEEQAIEQAFHTLENEYYTIGNIPASELAKIAEEASQAWRKACELDREAGLSEMKARQANGGECGMARPYAWKNTLGQTMRKWRSDTGTTRISEQKPDDDRFDSGWKQIPLSPWDYDCNIKNLVEYEPLEK